MRREKNGDRYFSFSELPGITQSEKTKTGKSEKALGNCKFCKSPLSYVEGTNVVICSNEKCKKNYFKLWRKEL